MTTALVHQRDIPELRADLAEKLDELHRRAKHARELVSPPPWTKIALGVIAGAIAAERPVARSLAIFAVGIWLGVRARRP